MTRIVYGISGEGSGHSSRAREVMTHLLAAGHEVRAVSYDRGYRNLKDDFDVFETEGLTIGSADNRVSVVKTFTGNIARLSDGVRKLRELRHEVFHAFDPQVVITDFEPMTGYLARHYELPLISLDNQHRMRYMRYPCPDGLAREARVTETVVRAMVPRPDVALVTTFFEGEVLNDRTFLFPPILRRAVLESVPTCAGHCLVYFTSGFDPFLDHLEAVPGERFVVYGTGHAGERGNLVFREPSRGGFLADLAASKAVIATAGFTLMTEALHLRKPMLALPMRGQFEQELNAHLLDQAGYGKNGREGGAAVVEEFFRRLPEYTERVATYPSADNSALEGKLDALLSEGSSLW